MKTARLALASLALLIASAIVSAGCASTNPLDRGAELFPQGPPLFGPHDPLGDAGGRAGRSSLPDLAMRLVKLEGGLADGALWGSATVLGFGPRLALSLVMPGILTQRHEGTKPATQDLAVVQK